jgi:hypothetical protein
MCLSFIYLLDIDWVPADSTLLALIKSVDLLHIFRVQLEVVDVRIRTNARRV